MHHFDTVDLQGLSLKQETLQVALSCKEWLFEWESPNWGLFRAPSSTKPYRRFFLKGGGPHLSGGSKRVQPPRFFGINEIPRPHRGPWVGTWHLLPLTWQVPEVLWFRSMYSFKDPSSAHHVTETGAVSTFDIAVNDIHELMNIINSTTRRGTLCILLPKCLASAWEANAVGEAHCRKW